MENVPLSPSRRAAPAAPAVRLIPDTNVWVAWLATGRWSLELETPARRILVSTIVLQELWAGPHEARRRRDLDTLYALAQRSRRLLNPTSVDWILSGRALAALARERRAQPARLRALRNDVLLAATGLTHRAEVLTQNVADFGLIATVLPVRYRKASAA